MVEAYRVAASPNLIRRRPCVRQGTSETAAFGKYLPAPPVLGRPFPLNLHRDFIGIFLRHHRPHHCAD